METERSTFAFLENESSVKHFADTDFALRQGRHIQHFGTDAKLWDYITDHYSDISVYYETLFGVFLRKATNDREVYYYLDFPEEGRGKFTRERSRELDARHVIFGILLLNIYKEKYFEEKRVTWNDLEHIINESEHRELWQRLLYGEAKRNYTPNEKDEGRRRIERTLWDFERMGWIHWVDSEALTFEILAGIDRIAKLYATEINNVELMTEYINEQLP
jgi:hypothetical protein